MLGGFLSGYGMVALVRILGSDIVAKEIFGDLGTSGVKCN